MFQEQSTTTISRLTELLAAHGIYALTIIFIFYQQWRAGQSLQAASAEDHAYFRKIHTTVVAATYVLVVVCTAVWIYATFVYVPKLYVRGSVSGLTDQSLGPQKDGDLRIVEKIAPESRFQIDLYQSTKDEDELASNGKYELGWMLVLPRQNMHALSFRFQAPVREVSARLREAWVL